MRIITFIKEAAPIRHSLQAVGEPHEPPSLHPPQGPPDWADKDSTLTLDEDLNQDCYEYEFDQRVSW